MQKITLPHNHGQRIEQELQRVPSTEEFQTVAELFKQMGGRQQNPQFLAFVPL